MGQRKESQLKRRKNEARRNAEALSGKMALFSTYEQMGLSESEYCEGLIRRIRRERNYFKVRSFHED